MAGSVVEAVSGDAIVAIDGGGTRTRAAVITRDGAIVGRAEAGPANDLQVGPAEALASLRRAAETAVRAADLPPDRIAAVSAGLAGVDYDGAGADGWLEALATMGFARRFVYGDMMTAHRGALAGAAGVVVIAGTGSVALGVGENGQTVKVGGWGPIYGNEGSAYAVGRDGLRAAARAWDGRGPATSLVDSLTAHLAVRDFQRSTDAVYARGMGQQEVAALAPVVYAAAQDGDDVANEICRTAGEDLADAVRAALARLAGARPRAVSYQGSVLLACDGIRSEFERRLRSTETDIEIHPPRFDAVMGAFFLGCAALRWDVPNSLADAADATTRTSGAHTP